MNILVVIDMQNDFIDGALGTKEAENIVEKVCDKISSFDGKVFFTMDTHLENYLDTQEGKKLPVKHCIKDTEGWQLNKDIQNAKDKLQNSLTIQKQTFASATLAQQLTQLNETKTIKNITLVGLCTDICVISNAMTIKAFLPETSITVDASCCAGVTPQSHTTALQAMQMCQIDIINQ